LLWEERWTRLMRRWKSREGAIFIFVTIGLHDVC
jgi:hypothetical protein